MNRKPELHTQCAYHEKCMRNGCLLMIRCLKRRRYRSATLDFSRNGPRYVQNPRNSHGDHKNLETFVKTQVLDIYVVNLRATVRGGDLFVGELPRNAGLSRLAVNLHESLTDDRAFVVKARVSAHPNAINFRFGTANATRISHVNGAAAGVHPRGPEKDGAESSGIARRDDFRNVSKRERKTKLNSNYSLR